MSDTQILVLTVTFLLAAVIVLPLTVIAYRKEKRRHEVNMKRERDAQARERRRLHQEKESARRNQASQARKKVVAKYDALKSRFYEIRYRLYASTPCAKCASNLVHIVTMGVDTGVLTCRCAKCGTQRRVYAKSKDNFLKEAPEMAKILKAYHAVQDFYPDYPGLAVSFPEPAPRA